MSECDHEYSQVVTHERTDDSVLECCHCEDVLDIAHPQELPEHWFNHTPGDAPHHKLAVDVLRDASPPRPNDAVNRYIHLCGNCQHWMGAVHGNYFEGKNAPLDRGEIGSFEENLMESLCPACGAANFRHGSLVLAHSDARFVKKEGYNLTQWVCDRADLRYWKGSSKAFVIEQPLKHIDYACRCPCCGYATSYGSRNFDFHHWDYDDDVGCMLCRNCHSHIHRGMTASEQGELSDSWESDAIRRLYDRATDKGLKFQKGHRFTARFNIPVNKDTRQTLSNLFTDEREPVPITELMADE